MPEGKGSLESLGALLDNNGFPAYVRRGLSPFKLQKMLEDGIAHHKAGRKEEAEQAYRKVLEIAPNQPDALNLLGVLAAEAELFDLAIDLMNRALSIRPKDPFILNNLGFALTKIHHFEDARDPLERAVALNGQFDEAKCNLAEVMRQVGEEDLALRLWREVWNGDDRVFAALVGITGILADKGQFDEAEKTAREVIARLPHRPAGYISLAHVHKFKTDDGTLAEIEGQIVSDEITDTDKVALHYAAGKICDDLQRYEQAFQHFDTANRQSNLHFNPAEVRKERQQMKTVFTKKFFDGRPDWGFASDLPVFIVGMPRSGTTLTEQILAAHSDVFGAGELALFERLSYLSEEISPGHDPFPVSALKLSKFGAELIGRRYIDKLRTYPDRAVKRITNKMPHNFETLGMIALTLPKAKIIHCRRSPMDTCLSCWTKNFNEAHSYNRSLVDLGHYYRGYYRLMEHWREVLPIEILDIDYEDYIGNFEATVRKILDFVELPWDPKCLEFYKAERAVQTVSNWQVRQPIYKSSVGRWQRYMPHIQPLLEALGPLAGAASPASNTD